jgi:murein DD-endopeptidase MepM/ murein hydrolase activator NlpD
MSITVIYSKDETEHSIFLAKKKFTVILVLFISVIIGCALLIQAHYKNQIVQFKETTTYERNAAKDKYLQQIQRQTNDKLMLLLKKVGQLESEINQLNLLGERVVERTNLPKNEFKFTKEKQVIPLTKVDDNFQKLVDNLETLTEVINNSKKQFTQLEIALNNLHRIKQKHISGRPINGKGTWISSHFGVRTDPFTKKLRVHKGVDIAGPIGTPVIASAAGVVVWAGKRSGYGKMVEINHGGGFVTRYAHAIAVNVSVGDVVKKGQQVVEMGSTGRSTGSHVHYEILRNGRQVDPDYYIHRT